MKTFCSLLTVLAVLTSSTLHAKENPYDTLGKVLMPFANLFAEKTRNPDRAATMTLQIEEGTDVPEALRGARVDVAFESPDKLKLHGPVLGEELTICRRGQELWVTPGSKVEALLNAASADKKLPPENPNFRLAPFKLPIPAKQLVFLPALFRVQSAGEETVGDQTCRVLDLQLMPELARALKEAQGWSARVWVGPDNKPVRLQVKRTDFSVTVRFTDVRFQPSLPAETWKPSPEQAADVLKISPARYDQLVRALLRAK
ncbi:LolA family protein [Verrucomicrobiota bacterium sgz303538]